MLYYCALSILLLPFTLCSSEKPDDLIHTVHVKALEEDLRNERSDRFDLFMDQIQALSPEQQLNKLHNFPFEQFKGIATINRQRELQHFQKTTFIIDALSYAAGLSGIGTGVPSHMCRYKPGIMFSEEMLVMCFALTVTSVILNLTEAKFSPNQRNLVNLAKLKKMYEQRSNSFSIRK